jgi:hypothetical protein
MTPKHIVIAACLLATACGEEEPSSYTEMNFEQRHAFMSEVVLPQMRATFVAFDADFADMTCATCHGSGASDGSYAMPSPDLPRLPPTEEAFLEYVKDPEHARWSQFMVDDVWPQMGALLELPLYDESTPDGFSCHGCHMVEGE